MWVNGVTLKLYPDHATFSFGELDPLLEGVFVVLLGGFQKARRQAASGGDCTSAAGVRSQHQVLGSHPGGEL